MVRSFPTIRRVATLVLLAVYGSVGVLGYGLHDLFHVHHHHGGACQGGCCHTSHCGDQCCHSHACERVPSSIAGIENVLERLEAVQTYRQNKRQSPQHASLIAVDPPCAICALLTQAQSPTPSICSGTLISAVPSEPPVDEVLQPLYLPSEHLARGPPVA